MKTILQQLHELEQLAGHNEGAGYEQEINALSRVIERMPYKAIWASPHTPQAEQIKSLEEQGYVIRFLKDVDPNLFDKLTNLQANSRRANLADRLLSLKCDAIVQPAGDPSFHMALGMAAQSRFDGGVLPLPEIKYSFTKRVSEDIPQADGSVKKVSVFRHEGWI